MKSTLFTEKLENLKKRLEELQGKSNFSFNFRVFVRPEVNDDDFYVPSHPLTSITVLVNDKKTFFYDLYPHFYDSLKETMESFRSKKSYFELSLGAGLKDLKKLFYREEWKSGNDKRFYEIDSTQAIFTYDEEKSDFNAFVDFVTGFPVTRKKIRFQFDLFAKSTVDLKFLKFFLEKGKALCDVVEVINVLVYLVDLSFSKNRCSIYFYENVFLPQEVFEKILESKVRLTINFPLVDPFLTPSLKLKSDRFILVPQSALKKLEFLTQFYLFLKRHPYVKKYLSSSRIADFEVLENEIFEKTLSPEL